MKAAVCCLTLVLVGSASAQPRLLRAKLETRTVASPFHESMRALVKQQTTPAWIGYSMPSVPGERRSCCCYGETVFLEGAPDFYVLIRAEYGQITRVRTSTPDCEIDAGDLPFIWFNGVIPQESLEFLKSVQQTRSALEAIALHRDAGADPTLEAYLASGQPDGLRAHAARLIGAHRGARGVEVLSRLLREESNERFREDVVRGLGNSRQESALKLLLETAKSDKNARIRAEAAFWVGQRSGSQSIPFLQSLIDQDPDGKVQERAISALAQIPNNEGVPALLELAGSAKSPTLRQHAVRELGRSRDPRARKFLEELLTR